jgi:hypothetical protein
MGKELAMLMNLHDDESDLKAEQAQDFEFDRKFSQDHSLELRLIEIGVELPTSFRISEHTEAFHGLEMGTSTYI